ncbi:MAG: sodium-dependent transporter [Synergistaceae bacterium]|nr:sodium-dependent transporter [Synergistaceae bacterium]
MENRSRETFGSRLGFIFLSAGCAIGLGNVWRFPFITGQYGGAAFVLVYIAFLLLLAMPIMVMEFAVGRASQRSVSQSFAVLRPEHKVWSWWGYAGWVGNYILMMFYTVVTGWMLAYTYYVAAGRLDGATAEQVGATFGGLLANPGELAFWMVLAIVFGFLICGAGLQKGVEYVTKGMMSGLLVLMIALAVRSVTLSGAAKGLEFYLKPDFGKIINLDTVDSFQGFIKSVHWPIIYAALGQAFFTLSIGIGSMAIFGSYIGRDRSLMGESLIITGLDTFVALMAGLIIFPACFAYDINPGAGPGLIFVTLPNMFNFMPSGRIWGTLFFLFMSFAALSTVVAVFENIIACFMDRLGWSRQKATVFMAVSVCLLSLPCALGFNVWAGFEPLGKGTCVLDLEDFILSNNLLPIGALVYLLFCVTRYGWGWKNFIAEADMGTGLKFPKGFLARFYMTCVAPLVMLGVLLMGYEEKFGLLTKIKEYVARFF